MATIALELSGLSCDHCVRAVEQALARVSGTERVQVTRQSARVEGSVSPEELLDAVRAEGYEARLS